MDFIQKIIRKVNRLDQVSGGVRRMRSDDTKVLKN